jgi:hypothetical protein
MLSAMNLVTLLGMPMHATTREAPTTIRSTAIPPISRGVMSLARIEKETTIITLVAMLCRRRYDDPLAT